MSATATVGAEAAHPYAASGARSLHPADAAEAAALSARARSAKPFAGQWGWRRAVATWLQNISPQVMLLGLAAVGAARWCCGPLGWIDAAIVAAFFAWQPFNEWLIHAYMLHLRPRPIGPKAWNLRFDLPTARRHRSHHANPWDLNNLFIPIGAILFSLAFHSALFFALLPANYALTCMVALLAVGLVYEWSHFMSHIPYRPFLPWMQTIQQRHRLHHFKNERFWLGVSNTFGDTVLGTLPDAKDVEPSPTARMLQRD